MTISSSQPIRVMVVDDHSMVRIGLATILMVFDDMLMVGEADSGKAAILLCEEVLPDVILMDMVMPDMDGASTIRVIRKKFLQIKVIALTRCNKSSLIKNAL